MKEKEEFPKFNYIYCVGMMSAEYLHTLYVDEF